MFTSDTKTLVLRNSCEPPLGELADCLQGRPSPGLVQSSFRDALKQSFGRLLSSCFLACPGYAARVNASNRLGC